MKNIAFIIKGNLKHKGSVMRNIQNSLKPGMELAFFETRGVGDGVAQTRKAMEAGAGYVIAVGGDGMVNELVNGYMECDAALRQKVILGVLPSGTGNDFIKSLGAPIEIKPLLGLIEDNACRTVDLGEIEYSDRNGRRANRRFANITDVGMGGYVVWNMETGGNFINANLTYQKAIIRTFLKYRNIEIRITAPDFTWEGPVMSAVFANGRFFGSGLCIAPDALLDDGRLQLVIMGNFTVWDYVKHLGKIRKGIKMDHPGVIYRPIGDCTITPINAECPIDMDGEYIGNLPMEVRALPGAVRFLANP